jgi:hypothetical protein
VRPAAAIFRDAPDFGLPTPKSGYGFLNPGKAPSGLGEGVRFFPTPGDPQERSIPDMVQCLLDNLNG